MLDLVIPVYRTTRQFKKGFRKMQDSMNEHMKQQQQSTSTDNTKPSSQKPAGDYIDFEEVK